jgi:uncharacterized RmlC-like cupin family protein
MPAWKRIPFHIDVDPAKPGRTQNWFDMAALEAALGRKITWVYSNEIAPGKTAGSHYHKDHEVLVWVASGELVMHLRDARVDEAETVVIKANSELLSIPAYVYHAGGNVGTEPCLAVMFASSKPRDSKDEYFL